MRDLADAVQAALHDDPNIKEVRLVGSRADGSAGELSDWDFAVETDDFNALAARLPKVVEPLEPLAAQWDPLGTVKTYMLMLGGGVKVDLIFDEPQEEEAQPWRVTPSTRPLIDHHFWDWTLWLAAKRAAGKDELVDSELERMHRYLLEPLGTAARPQSLEDAVESYLGLRDSASAVERDVLPLLRRGA